MFRLESILLLGTLSLGVLLVAIPGASSDQPHDRQQILGDWRYPGSDVINSDGSSGSGSVSQTRALMTTADSLDDVVKYYETKKNCPLTPKTGPGSSNSQLADEMVTQFKDDSARRPLTLRILKQSTKTFSTTLIISRADGETTTHIYWSMTRF